MSWFKKDKPATAETVPAAEEGEKKVRTEGLWEKCEGCRQIIWKKDLDANLNVCPKCQYHFRLDARTRLATLLDNSEWEETETNLSSTDPLKFVDTKAYKDRLAKAQKETEISDAIINAEGTLEGKPVIASAMETTTTAPITLYQSQEISVYRAVARIAVSPTSIPKNAAVPRTRRNPSASTKQPSSVP